MKPEINLDSVIDLYLSEKAARMTPEYEALFKLPEEETQESAVRSVEDARAAATRRPPPGEEEVGPVSDFIDADLPDRLEKMIQEAFDWLHEDDRPFAAHGLTLVTDDSWSVPTVLEILVHYMGVQAASHLFHALVPETVFPIQYSHYNELKGRLGILGIRYSDHHENPVFYPHEILLSLSDAVEEFRLARKLEHWQVWALVYDLAPRLLPALPPYPSGPVRVWLSASGPESMDELEEMQPSDRGTWSINSQAKRGDLLLIYCLRPRSAITSLLRVEDDAALDPFDDSWGGIAAPVTDRLALPPVSLREMQEDPVLGRWGLVRRNFQGLLGAKVPPEMWQRLKTLISDRDPEAGRILERYEVGGTPLRLAELTERQFEVSVLLPLLERIGWQVGKNLEREFALWIPIGSGKPKGVRADLVGLRAQLSGEALMVIETKQSIASDVALKTARKQCESYAGKLRCSRFAVAAPEGIWIYRLRFPTVSEHLAHIPWPSAQTAADAPGLELLSYTRLVEERRQP